MALTYSAFPTDTSGAPKPDRSMSPNTGMSEDERRELIARQHRALYGNESNLYSPEGAAAAANAAAAQRRQSQDVRVGSVSGPAGPRGASPFDSFGAQAAAAAAAAQANGGETAVQMPPRDLPKSPNSASSPSSNPTSFNLIDNAQQQSSRTSVSSPSGSPPLGQSAKQQQQQPTTAAGVVPIGTRPAQPAAVSSLNKRSTTPLSPLSYGFNAGGEQVKTERSASAASSVAADKPISGLGASWSSSNGGWGAASKNPLGVQASVWG